MIYLDALEMSNATLADFPLAKLPCASPSRHERAAEERDAHAKRAQ